MSANCFLPPLLEPEDVSARVDCTAADVRLWSIRWSNSGFIMALQIPPSNTPHLSGVSSVRNFVRTSPRWGLARSRLRGFWSGFVLSGVSPASCSKRPDVAVRSARHEASGSVYFIKLSAGLGSCFPQLFGENKAR